MSKTTFTLPRPVYRWAFALLPLLVLVLSACGTGGNSGSLGYCLQGLRGRNQ
jgi:hypothetical protein